MTVFPTLSPSRRRWSCARHGKGQAAALGADALHNLGTLRKLEQTQRLNVAKIGKEQRLGAVVPPFTASGAAVAQSNAAGGASGGVGAGALEPAAEGLEAHGATLVASAAAKLNSELAAGAQISGTALSVTVGGGAAAPACAEHGLCVFGADALTRPYTLSAAVTYDQVHIRSIVEHVLVLQRLSESPFHASRHSNSRNSSLQRAPGAAEGGGDGVYRDIGDAMAGASIQEIGRASCRERV